MKPFAIGVVLAVTLSAPVCAEPLAVPLSVYATAAALDLHTTHRFLQYEGFHETSWMSRLEHRPGTMVAVSALADAGMVYALSRVVDLKVFGGPHRCMRQRACACCMRSITTRPSRRRACGSGSLRLRRRLPA